MSLRLRTSGASGDGVHVGAWSAVAPVEDGGKWPRDIPRGERLGAFARRMSRKRGRTAQDGRATFPRWVYAVEARRDSRAVRDALAAWAVLQRWAVVMAALPPPVG